MLLKSVKILISSSFILRPLNAHARFMLASISTLTPTASQLLYSVFVCVCSVLRRRSLMKALATNATAATRVYLINMFLILDAKAG